MLEVLRMASGWHYGKAVPFHIISSCFRCVWETEKSTDISSPWGWMFSLLLWNQNMEESGEKNWSEQNGRSKQKHFPVQTGSNPVIWESKCNRIFLSGLCLLALTNQASSDLCLSLVILSWYPKHPRKGHFYLTCFLFYTFKGLYLAIWFEGNSLGKLEGW